MDNDPDALDQLAVLRAQMDQALGLAPELVRAYRAYFNEFTAQGFTESQALYLSAAQMLQNPGRPA